MKLELECTLLPRKNLPGPMLGEALIIDSLQIYPGSTFKLEERRRRLEAEVFPNGILPSHCED